MQVFTDLEQGSPEWFAARAGIPTASRFATVMAKGEGKTRSEYMRKLAGEILTGEPSEQFSNIHTDRGNAMEDEAREATAIINDAEIQRVGLIPNRNHGHAPDSFLGAQGG